MPVLEMSFQTTIRVINSQKLKVLQTHSLMSSTFFFAAPGLIFFQEEKSPRPPPGRGATKCNGFSIF